MKVQRERESVPATSASSRASLQLIHLNDVECFLLFSFFLTKQTTKKFEPGRLVTEEVLSM